MVPINNHSITMSNANINIHSPIIRHLLPIFSYFLNIYVCYNISIYKIEDLLHDFSTFNYKNRNRGALYYYY